MRSRGHQVNLWSPLPFFSKLPFKGKYHKWLGYIDQYIVFPSRIKKKLRNIPPDTLFVFSDHALGPWVPMVKNFPHVIHCHDFLAQRSALDQIPENKLGWTGKTYQRFIRKGYLQGKYFISISKKTKHDLHQFLIAEPLKSEMVYNGLNQKFNHVSAIDARIWITKNAGIYLDNGFIIHVGGNQFYKNRMGVIEIYDQWRLMSDKTFPLLLIGEAPETNLKRRHYESPFKDSIHFLTDKNDQFVRVAYSGAQLMLYPSIAEGFGWPIAEAMASGCPVITTNEAPMNEVAGQAAFFIPIKPKFPDEIIKWAKNAGGVLEEILNFTSEKRADIISRGIENTKRFDPQIMLDEIELIYKEIVGETT